jgi:hypothetical protein
VGNKKKHANEWKCRTTRTEREEKIIAKKVKRTNSRDREENNELGRTHETKMTSNKEKS